MKRIKNLLAMVLAVCLLLSTVLTVAATEDEDITEIKDASISDLMDVDKENPLGDDITPPFNAAEDSSILMTKENELMLYASNSGQNEKDINQIVEKMDADTTYALDDGTSPPS